MMNSNSIATLFFIVSLFSILLNRQNLKVDELVEMPVLMCDRESDSLALVDLYNSTGGLNWTYTSTIFNNGNNLALVPNAGNAWNFNTPIDSWHGVEINSDGCVTVLALYFNNLEGTIPNFNLPNLQHLDCSSNNLSGNIPNFNLPNLQSFYCADNNLSGNIPDFNLPDLQYFHCQANDLDGAIPNFNFPNLQQFICSFNNLSGSIPDFNLPNLRRLDCFLNNLGGTIPNFDLPNLQYLSCGQNNLTGEIPDFNNLPNLESFSCNDNNLSGCFPSYVCNLSSFNAINNVEFPWQGDHANFCNGQSQTGANCDDGYSSTSDDIIQSDCSCNGVIVCDRQSDSLALVNLFNTMGGINWTYTYTLGVPNSGNPWNFNEPIDTWHGVELNTEGCVTTLALGHNGLIGNLPELNWPGLEYFNCSNNQITGEIPNFSNLSNLDGFYCHSNLLTGEIPNVTNPNITYFYCYDNLLTGEIPDFSMNNLQSFACHNNQLTGEIPDFSKINNLYYFSCDYNQLTGEIPDFTNLPDLRSFQCQYNYLGGEIPDFSDNCSFLKRFHFRNNQYTFENILPSINPNEDLIFANSTNFSDTLGYAPQELIYKDTQILIIEGDDLVLDLLIDEFIPTNLYQWYKDGAPYINIIGNNDLVFTNIQPNDAGIYTVQITNPEAPKLTLESYPIEIVVQSMQSCNRESDSLALVELYNSMGGDNWIYSATTYSNGTTYSIPNAGTIWDFNTPISTWHGVQLTSQGCVELMALNENNLQGVIPDMNLPHLTEFYCYNNQLSGGIPDFSFAQNLQILSCSINNLSGNIPDFTNIPNLIDFRCTNNNLDGNIPNFSNIPALESFYCFSNNLTGEILDFSNTPNLIYFYCSQNSFTGEIPNFLNLNNLRFFDCENNNLSGEIPDFTNTPDLLSFVCGGNGLTGEIPDFTNLPILEYFSCNDNNLSGCFPSFVCNLAFFDAINNIELPWLGDHTNFCNGQSQIGSDCDDGYSYTSSDMIQGDCSCSGSIVCNRENDSLALVELYNATDGDNWIYSSTTYFTGFVVGTPIPNAGNPWDFNSPMDTWHGVGLNFDGCVISLALNSNGLNGVLPNLNLPHLAILNCNDNELFGDIPEFSNVPSLIILLCTDNQLTGELPDFSNTPELRRLRCYSNQLSGNIPDFPYLPNLIELSCGLNQLTGEIPDFSNMPNLERLSLYSNQLIGEIPDFSNLPNLETFSCSFNQLTGQIPDFQNLTNLEQINCYSNQFTGVLPDLSNLNSLVVFRCDSNYITGCYPAYICDLSSFSAHNNNELPWQGDHDNFCNGQSQIGAICDDGIVNSSGDIIQSDCSCSGVNICDRVSDSLALVELFNAAGGVNWTYTSTTYGSGFSNTNPIPNAGTPWNLNEPIDTWHGVGLNASGCVEILALKNNGLTGSLPDLNLPFLEEFNCELNDLTGTIPDFSNLMNLHTFFCGWNELTGQIPNFSNLPQLRFFNCYINQLTDTIPNFQNTPNLEDFSCYNNQLTGSIPDFSNTPLLDEFSCANNMLSGEIPDFSNIPNLRDLTCASNLLTGSIPNFSNLPNLRQIVCYSNNLTGTIPDFSNLEQLFILDCEDNQLTGEIPDFSNLGVFRALRCAENQLIGEIPDFTNLSTLRDIDCSSNNLSGEIPDLSDNCPSLKLFYNNNNKFTFEDILPSIDSNEYVISTNATSGIYIYKYYMQDSIFKDTVFNMLEGESLTIDLLIDENISDNQYQWYKNDIPYTSFTGNNNLEFNNILYSDAGIYTVHVTNPNAPNLTLESYPIEIKVNCPNPDRPALLAIYEALDGDNWTTSWDTTTCDICTWYGVNCDSLGRVICIDLDGNPDCEFSVGVNNISQFGGNNLVGQIPSEIGDLVELEFLSLEADSIFGNIPTELGQLTNLTSLNLSLLHFNSDLPSSFNQLSNLINLALINSKLNGNVSSLNNHPTLQFIYVCNNLFTGNIPLLNTPLLGADFSNNLFLGGLPNFSNSPNLIGFDCSNNSLTGSISDLSVIPNLESFVCHSNELDNGIPLLTGNPNLEYFSCGDNNLEGALPDFSNNNNLREFYCHNNKLTGSIDFSSVPNLTVFLGYGNNFSGLVPLLPNDGKRFYFYNNQFTFENILLHLNSNHTTIDANKIEVFDSLIYAPQDTIYIDTTFIVTEGDSLIIDLLIDEDIIDNNYQWYQNGMQDTMITGNNNLEFYSIQLNDAGEYYVEVTNSGAIDLVLISYTFNIIVNPCTHPDKQALTELYQMAEGDSWTNSWDTTKCDICLWYGVTCDANDRVVHLDLNSNNLIGSLPDMNLPFLQNLQCNNNQLSGEIPDFSGLSSLEILSCDGNQLTGEIPDFSSLFNLVDLSLDDNNLTGEIPDFSNLINLEKLACDGNQLTGEIPDFSNLVNLTSLECDDNLLTGSIPIFSNLPNLETLICNSNNLSGCYPSFICNLLTFNSLENPQLPWQGDHTDFCNGDDQIGAICDDGDSNTIGEVIQSDCSCAPIPCTFSCLDTLFLPDNTPLLFANLFTQGDLNLSCVGGNFQLEIFNNLNQSLVGPLDSIPFDCNYFEEGLTITITETNSGITCSSVLSNSNPISVSLGTDTLICLGDSIILDADNPNCSTCVYEWNNTFSNPVQTLIPTTPSTIIATVTDLNGCMVSDSIFIDVGEEPEIPEFFGENMVCIGDVEQYTISNFNNVLTYDWQLPNGATITDNGTFITVDYSNAVSGDLCLLVNNDCGSNSSCLSVDINSFPVEPSLTTGSTTVCENETITYCIEPVANADSYLWELPTGTVLTDQLCQTIVWSSGANPFFSVKAQNECGESTSLDIPIQWNALPTAVIVSSDLTTCVNEPFDLEILFIGDSPFQLEYSDGNQLYTLSGITDNPLFLSYATDVPLNFSLVSVSNDNCEGVTSGEMFVDVEAIPLATTSKLICEGESYLFGNDTLTTAGFYENTFVSTNGCDSIVQLELSVEIGIEFSIVDDIYLFDEEIDNIILDITKNDTLPNTNWEIILPTSSTTVGIFSLKNDNTIKYEVLDEDYTGRDSFQYFICQTSCPNNCDSAWAKLQFESSCIKEAKERIVSGFTPNGDGINDFFHPFVEFEELGCTVDYSQVKITIVNRWKEVVFEADPYPFNGWDGANGENSSKILPPATYYYLLEIRLSNEAKVIKGPIQLLR